MLRTMVHHLIAQGITHGALAQMLKEIYLDVAEAEFSLSFKRQTDSRLALVTGLNRKEIARLRRCGCRKLDHREIATVISIGFGRKSNGIEYVGRSR
ncbi:MAG: hypothetical protein HY270_12805 [Deltaproteobacteria bacterium]|nr:hypothetical protein [Deltaproteobacteria bacterium]